MIVQNQIKGGNENKKKKRHPYWITIIEKNKEDKNMGSGNSENVRRSAKNAGGNYVDDGVTDYKPIAYDENGNPAVYEIHIHGEEELIQQIEANRVSKMGMDQIETTNKEKEEENMNREIYKGVSEMGLSRVRMIWLRISLWLWKEIYMVIHPDQIAAYSAEETPFMSERSVEEIDKALSDKETINILEVLQEKKYFHKVDDILEESENEEKNIQMMSFEKTYMDSMEEGGVTGSIEVTATPEGFRATGKGHRRLYVAWLRRRIVLVKVVSVSDQKSHKPWNGDIHKEEEISHDGEKHTTFLKG